MTELMQNFEKILTVNTKVNFVVRDGDYAGVYDSRVEDFDKDGSILMAVPSNSGVPVPLVPGTMLEVTFMGPDSRYRFASQITGRTKAGSVFMLVLKRPDDIARDQMREFFRVSTRIKVKIYLFYSNVPDENLKIPHDSVDGIVVDLSGGGCRIMTDATVVRGQLVKVDFGETFEKLSEINGKIMRVVKREGKNDVSISFKFKKESERNPVIKYVFKRQIELKQIRG
jgi:c-di-GMP-binding flagellar brake protein YcgR